MNGSMLRWWVFAAAGVCVCVGENGEEGGGQSLVCSFLRPDSTEDKHIATSENTGESQEVFPKGPLSVNRILLKYSKLV